MLNNTITSPLASLLILVLGTQFFQTYLALALEAAEYSKLSIGLVHTSSYAGLLVSALYSEKIIYRVGHIRAFTAFSCIITTTILLQAFYQELNFWILARFCSGFALAALYITIESWLLANSTAVDRSKKLAIYMIILYFSQAISPQFLHVINLNSLEPFILAALFCTMASIPVSLTKQSAPIVSTHSTLKIKEIFLLNPYSFIGCFIAGLILSSLYSFMPNCANESSLSVAWVMSTLICGGFLLQWPLGKLSNLFNREKTLLFIAAFCRLPATCLLLFPTLTITYLFIFLIGGFSFALYPLSIALACDYLGGKCIIQVTSVLLFAYSLGAVAGPLFSAATIDLFHSNWAIFAFILLVLSCYVCYGYYIQKYLIKITPANTNINTNINTNDCVIVSNLPNQGIVMTNQIEPAIAANINIEPENILQECKQDQS